MAALEQAKLRAQEQEAAAAASAARQLAELDEAEAAKKQKRDKKEEEKDRKRSEKYLVRLQKLTQYESQLQEAINKEPATEADMQEMQAAARTGKQREAVKALEAVQEQILQERQKQQQLQKKLQEKDLAEQRQKLEEQDARTTATKCSL